MKRVPNPPGRCIFCGRLGVTKEHMWADWLRKYVPRPMRGHAVSLTKHHIRGTEEKLLRQTGDPHSRRIKCVCKDCNSGWMSRLQERAKPYIVPLLHGTPVALARPSQTILSAWISMMVMVAEHLNAEMVAISAADRKFLKYKVQPPSHWRIWIGNHAATHHALFSHNAVSFAFEEEIQRLGLNAAQSANTQTSTILLGKHLLIYVMSSERAWNIIRQWQNPPQFASSLTEIWPVRQMFAVWPPTGIALRDREIAVLTDHFYNACNTLARERIAQILR